MNTNNIHNPGLLQIQIKKSIVMFFTENKNFIFICEEYSQTYSLIFEYSLISDMVYFGLCQKKCSAK